MSEMDTMNTNELQDGLKDENGLNNKENPDEQKLTDIPDANESGSADSKETDSGKANQEQEFSSGNENGSPASFPVDLSFDEYVRFNLIVSKTAGMLRLRKGQITLFSIMMGFCLFMLYSDMVTNGRIDIVTVIFMLMLAAIEGIMLYGVPAYIRRSAGRMYEQTIESGHSYYGIVNVYADRMEKCSSQNTVRIRYQESAVYIETREMMILMAPDTPAIVLPARCLTKENADVVRRAVLPGVLPQRQRLIERMIPAALVPIEPPTEENRDGGFTEENTLMELDVDYTREEFIKLALTGALHGYMKMLPIYCAASVMTGLLFGISYNFGIGIISFLMIQAVFFAVQMIGARSKAAKLFGSMPEEGSRIHIRFTEHGLVMRSHQDGEIIRLAWPIITRAIEKPDSVEFYTKTAFLDIPKRCIEDMNTMRSIVDAHYCTPVKKNNR